MISLFNNSFKKWIRNICRNVFVAMIFRKTEVNYYVRGKSIRYIGCLTIIVNNDIIFYNKVIPSVDKTLSERNGVTVFQKVFIISHVFLIKIPAI